MPDVADGQTRFDSLRRDATADWVLALTVASANGVVADFALADLNSDGLADDLNWELAWTPRQGAGFGAVRTLALPKVLSPLRR